MKSIRRRTWWLLALAVARPAGDAGAQVSLPVLTPQSSGTQVLLQAVSPVNRDVVWASGHRGTFVRTTDGGATWTPGVVPGADSLQFRDVHAVSADVAYVLAAGPGDRSRIYRTLNAGRDWRLQFLNADSLAFFDCFDFWDAEHGLAFSDAVDGQLIVVTTANGGGTWARLPADRLPPAEGSEGGFAASGTCLVTLEDSTALIATGAGSRARVLRTDDRGLTWTAAATPVVQGTASSGLASLAFWDQARGMAAGGDLAKPEEYTDNVARTDDGGRTWTLARRPPFPGGVYGSATVPGSSPPTVIMAGPKGLAYTPDWGASWVMLGNENYWAVGSAHRRSWAVGPSGRITRIDW